MALSQSTPVEVDASGSGFSQAKYNTSKSLLLYDNNTALRARACDISSGSVSLGTAVDIIGATSRGEGDLDQLATGEVICCYNDVDDSNQYKLVVLSVSGTGITVETPVDISTFAGNGSRAMVTACTDALGFCSVNVGAGEQWARFTVGGVGGKTVTVTDTGSPSVGLTYGLTRLDNTRVIRYFGDQFGNASWSIIDISSGITEGTDASDTDRDPKAVGSRGHLVNVDGDKIVCVYTETTSSPDESVAVVIDTSTGTTITGLGSFLTLTSNSTVAGGACCMTDSDTILAYHVGASSTGKIETFDISGTTLTSNSDQINATYGHAITTLELLESGKALIYFQNHVAIVTGIPASGTAELRHLSIDTDVQNFYITSNEGGTLKLFTYDIQSSMLQMTESFGAVTFADLDNGVNDLQVNTKADKVLYLWGKDGSDIITQYNDKNGTLGWVDVGAGTATWGTALVARGLELDPLDPTDVLIGFTDGTFYRTETGTSSWTASSGSVGSDIRNLIRHPVIDSQVLVGGTAVGTIHYTHNYAYSFQDTGGTVAGTINGWAIDR